MKEIVFSILLFLCPLSYSQFIGIETKEAFIINQNNDTIHGKIKIKDISSLSRKIIFSDSNNILSTYTASDIKAYAIDSTRFYISQKEINPNLPHPRFMKTLVEGKYNLYLLQTGATNLSFYLKDSTNKLTCLGEPYDTIINETSIRREPFHIQLKQITKNDPKFLFQIDATPYNTDKLSSLIFQYNSYLSNTHKNKLYSYKSPKNQCNTIMLDGFYWDKYLYSGLSFIRSFYLAEISKKISFNIGLSYIISSYSGTYEFRDKFYARSILTKNDLNVFSQSSIAEYNAHHVFEIHWQNTDYFYQYLSIPFYCNYDFTLRKIQPYIYGGIMLGWLNTHFYLLDDKNQNLGTNVPPYYKPYSSLLTTNCNINGIRLMLMYGLGVRYWITQNLTAFCYLRQDRLVHYGAGMGYAFKTKK